MTQQDSAHQQQLERKRKYWREQIINWQDSELSQIEYCRRHELVYHRFVYWREKFAPKPAASFSIVEVPMSAIKLATERLPRPTPIRVCLDEDLGIDILPGFDPLTLQQIVIALRGLP